MIEDFARHFRADRRHPGRRINDHGVGQERAALVAHHVSGSGAGWQEKRRKIDEGGDAVGLAARHFADDHAARAVFNQDHRLSLRGGQLGDGGRVSLPRPVRERRAIGSMARQIRRQHTVPGLFQQRRHALPAPPPCHPPCTQDENRHMHLSARTLSLPTIHVTGPLRNERWPILRTRYHLSNLTSSHRHDSKHLRQSCRDDRAHHEAIEIEIRLEQIPVQIPTRPFRFGVQISTPRKHVAWAEQARQAEALGYDVFLMPDHFLDQFAIGPALVIVAEATALRIGTFVLQNHLRHPALIAQEAATLDVLSDGRFELGLGAGGSWLPDYQRPVSPSTLPEPELLAWRRASPSSRDSSPRVRHLCRPALLDHGARRLPKPVQRPHPPILIGGGGPRMLSLAAREANIVSILPTMFRLVGQFREDQLSDTAFAKQVDVPAPSGRSAASRPGTQCPPPAGGRHR